MKQQKKENSIPSPEELFAEYAPLIFKTASGHLNNPEDCRECVNDTFLEFYKHPERYNPKKGTLAAYLTAIAGKKAISKWRKNKRQGRTESLVLEESAVQGDSGIQKDEADQISSRLDLEQALSSLNKEELCLIRLKYYEGMSISEIAADMQLPYETVKKRHQRTLKKLRLLLLIIVLLSALAGCAIYLAKKMGIIPGYGAVTEDEESIYFLEEPISIPISGTPWEAQITTAVYQGDSLSIRYHLTDEEGRWLLYSELGGMTEYLGNDVWEHNYSVGISAENYLYIGPGHYHDFEPLETSYIGNAGPEYFDVWLEAFNYIASEYQEDGDVYPIWEPVWEHESLPAVIKGEEEVTFTFASDIVIRESESGLIWKNDAEYDSWTRQLTESRHRFETSLTLRKIAPETINDYTCDYSEEYGGVLAIPRLQEGNLIVALYPLQGSQGRIVTGIVTANAYYGTAEDTETGAITAVAEDGTVLTGTLLGGTRSEAELYSEWDFGPAKPGTYKLKIPYLLKCYDGGDKMQYVSIPFSLKRGTISNRTVTLDGISVTASNLQPLDWEELLWGSHSNAYNYYTVKDSPFYSGTERLWSFELAAKAMNPEETVVSVNMGISHKNAGIFNITGDTTGIFFYDLPEDGKMKCFMVWEDADNQMYANPLDTWSLELHAIPSDVSPLGGSGTLTRWDHPVELLLTVEES